jgi:predicted naringenin-chalcone synthase
VKVNFDQMDESKILAVATEPPPYTKNTEEILAYMDNFLSGQPERFRRKVLRIFKNAGVDRRYSIMSAEDVFTELSFEEKNNLYIRQAIKFSEIVLKKALDKSALSATDIDFIITVSCTGFMIPSVDAYLINALRMRQDVVRLPVTEMGCAAGVSGMIYASQFLKANPGKTAAVIAFESPTSTFQHRDLSMTNMVSAAIFGDGAACVLLGNEENRTAPVIVDSEMYHFYDETDMMGFRLKNTGLEMMLDVRVPDKIEQRFDEILHPFLNKNGLTINDIDHLIFHPGGKKIVRLVENSFKALGKNIDLTRAVLREHGNMSSATVLYVLEEFLKKNIKKGEKGLMLSFGPGFSAQRILLEWR